MIFEFKGLDLGSRVREGFSRLAHGAVEPLEDRAELDRIQRRASDLVQNEAFETLSPKEAFELVQMRKALGTIESPYGESRSPQRTLDLAADYQRSK